MGMFTRDANRTELQLRSTGKVEAIVEAGS